MPGVFVAGDVRHGSVKRLGAAVGDGAAVVHYIHRYLKERQRPKIPASMANRT